MKKRVEVEGRVRHKRGSDSVRKCTLGRETDTQVALCPSVWGVCLNIDSHFESHLLNKKSITQDVALRRESKGLKQKYAVLLRSIYGLHTVPFVIISDEWQCRKITMCYFQSFCEWGKNVLNMGFLKVAVQTSHSDEPLLSALLASLSDPYTKWRYQQLHEKLTNGYSLQFFTDWFVVTTTNLLHLFTTFTIRQCLCRQTMITKYILKIECNWSGVAWTSRDLTEQVVSSD